MSEKETVIPEEFSKVMKDLVEDIQNTFPEMNSLIAKWWKPLSTFDYIDDEEERKEKLEKSRADSILFLFKFAQKKFPPRFFDILYENNEIFKEDSGVDTEFLPHIHFKNLWQFDISDKTRETMWKYLQLIMFSIISSIQNKDAFGDSDKFYEAFNQEDFKTKLEETLNKMQGLFENTPETSHAMPNADHIHDHISGMLDGKLGKLAKEIAEETAENLNMDMENVTDMKGAFEQMMKNPAQLMNLVKNVGDKLETRIKSGEIKESELISEAAQMMGKMKDIPGMDNIQSLLSKMGMSGLSGLGKNANTNQNANANTNANANLNTNLDQINKTMEIMQNLQLKERSVKTDASRMAKEKPTSTESTAYPPFQPALSDEQLEHLFSVGKTESSDKSDKKKKGKKAKK